MRLILLAAPLLLTFSNAFAADAMERKFITQGMSEGAVVMKIGKPDSESIDTGHYATDKHWIYFPEANDSETLTSITLRNGKVFKVNREISR